MNNQEKSVTKQDILAWWLNVDLNKFEEYLDPKYNNRREVYLGQVIGDLLLYLFGEI